MAFSPETLDFLWGIRFNNNREWFTQHKEQYRRCLYEPMKALAAQVAPAFEQVPQLRLHLSRIYRDMRMHPSTFYKDSLWFCLRRDGGPWLEHPCLCFEIRPEGYRYGFLLAHVPAARRQLLRQKLLDHSDRFLALLDQAQQRSGIRLSGEPFARKQSCPEPRLQPYFDLKNFLAIRERPADELLFSEALADEVRSCLLAWLEVSEFFQI